MLQPILIRLRAQDHLIQRPTNHFEQLLQHHIFRHNLLHLLLLLHLAAPVSGRSAQQQHQAQGLDRAHQTPTLGLPLMSFDECAIFFLPFAHAYKMDFFFPFGTER